MQYIIRNDLPNKLNPQNYLMTKYEYIPERNEWFSLIGISRSVIKNKISVFSVSLW